MRKNAKLNGLYMKAYTVHSLIYEHKQRCKACGESLFKECLGYVSLLGRRDRVMKLIDNIGSCKSS
jgi:hypothetical protein